jgi:hypothetical protein
LPLSPCCYHSLDQQLAYAPATQWNIVMIYRSLLLILVIVGFSSTAAGMAVKLKRPLIGFAQGLDDDPQRKAEQQMQAEVVLTFIHQELIFLDGHLNGTSVYHRFGGTSQQTSRFIQLLEASTSWKVRVRFQDFGEQQTAFRLDHAITGDTMVLTVNAGRDDFRLKDFQSYLPKPPQRPASANLPPE